MRTLPALLIVNLLAANAGAQLEFKKVEPLTSGPLRFPSYEASPDNRRARASDRMSRTGMYVIRVESFSARLDKELDKLVALQGEKLSAHSVAYQKWVVEKVWRNVRDDLSSLRFLLRETAGISDYTKGRAKEAESFAIKVLERAPRVYHADDPKSVIGKETGKS